MAWLTKILVKGNKSKGGFTLIELMVVVIIVGILAAAAVPIYRFALDRAYSSEAKAALGTIRAAESVEHAENAAYKATTDILTDLGVDPTKNTWFNNIKYFKVVVVGDTFTAYADGSNAVDGDPGFNKIESVQITLTDAGVWGTEAMP